MNPILWNLLISWALNFVVWQRWTCSWTLEFVAFKLYEILLKLINNFFIGILNSWIVLPTKYTKLNVQQIKMISKYMTWHRLWSSLEIWILKIIIPTLPSLFYLILTAMGGLSSRFWSPLSLSFCSVPEGDAPSLFSKGFMESATYSTVSITGGSTTAGKQVALYATDWRIDVSVILYNFSKVCIIKSLIGTLNERIQHIVVWFF